MLQQPSSILWCLMDSHFTDEVHFTQGMSWCWLVHSKLCVHGSKPDEMMQILEDILADLFFKVGVTLLMRSQLKYFVCIGIMAVRSMASGQERLFL